MGQKNKRRPVKGRLVIKSSCDMFYRFLLDVFQHKSTYFSIYGLLLCKRASFAVSKSMSCSLKGHVLLSDLPSFTLPVSSRYQMSDNQHDRIYVYSIRAYSHSPHTEALSVRRHISSRNRRNRASGIPLRKTSGCQRV